MIVTLKITLLRGRYYKGPWSVNIELEESSTLQDLYEAIQQAVEFDDDHQYCFFVARTDRSWDKEYFDDENGLLYSRKLKDTFPLPKNRSLFYLFDWGDSWIFKVSPSRKRPCKPVKGVEYPRIESELGKKPVQYPDPDYDEDDDK